MSKKEKPAKPELPPQKMIFSRVTYLDPRDPPLYQPGIVYEVPGNMVGRWLKRGGKIVTEEPKAPPKVEAPPQAPKEPVAPPEKKAEDKPKPTPQKPVASAKATGNKK